MRDYLYKVHSLSLQKHKILHREAQHSCKMCTFKATTLISLTEHSRLEHSEKGLLDPFQCSRNPPEPYRCYYCDFKTNLLVEYNEHAEKTKQDPDKLRNLIPNQICVQCKFETFSRLIMFKHVSSGCLVDREQAELMLASLRAEIPENQIEVLHYDAKTLQASSVREEAPEPPKSEVAPEQSYGRSKKVICDQCGQQLGNSTSLSFHVLLKHTAPEDIKWFECPECAYKAKLSSQLFRHMLTMHNDEETKIYKCSLCSYRAMDQARIRTHCKVVHAEGADVEWFQCRFCPHKTRWRQHLKRHEKEQHQGDFKKFQCEHCPYRAKQKIHMKLHVAQKHTPDAEIEWFRCDKCDYKAKLKASLKSHTLKKHTSSDKIDWFVCDKCGFKALERSLLRKHMEKKH